MYSFQHTSRWSSSQCSTSETQHHQTNRCQHKQGTRTKTRIPKAATNTGHTLWRPPSHCRHCQHGPPRHCGLQGVALCRVPSRGWRTTQSCFVRCAAWWCHERSPGGRKIENPRSARTDRPSPIRPTKKCTKGKCFESIGSSKKPFESQVLVSVFPPPFSLYANQLLHRITNGLISRLTRNWPKGQRHLAGVSDFLLVVPQAQS